MQHNWWLHTSSGSHEQVVQQSIAVHSMPAMPEAVVAASGAHIAKTAQLLCFPHPGAVGPGLIIIHGHARRDQELVEGSLLVFNLVLSPTLIRPKAESHIVAMRHTMADEEQHRMVSRLERAEMQSPPQCILRQCILRHHLSRIDCSLQHFHWPSKCRVRLGAPWPREETAVMMTHTQIA